MRPLAFGLILLAASCGSSTGSPSDASVGSDSLGSGDSNTSTCALVVHPESGGPADVFTVSGSGFPAGTMTAPTKVLLEFTNPSGVATTRTFLTLVAGATSFLYKFHEQEAPQEPAPAPLDKGTWRVLGEDEGHVCSLQVTFAVK
jgi:hypothetical protein